MQWLKKRRAGAIW
uniref:Uncharacterized protein n=1 Tax=Anguilla anguilla TaxID=7936 RepID=A0A0E9VFL4_ANGAN